MRRNQLDVSAATAHPKPPRCPHTTAHRGVQALRASPLSAGRAALDATRPLLFPPQQASWPTSRQWKSDGVERAGRTPCPTPSTPQSSGPTLSSSTSISPLPDVPAKLTALPHAKTPSAVPLTTPRVAGSQPPASRTQKCVKVFPQAARRLAACLRRRNYLQPNPLDRVTRLRATSPSGSRLPCSFASSAARSHCGRRGAGADACVDGRVGLACVSRCWCWPGVRSSLASASRGGYGAEWLTIKAVSGVAAELCDGETVHTGAEMLSGMARLGLNAAIAYNAGCRADMGRKLLWLGRRDQCSDSNVVCSFSRTLLGSLCCGW